jgi:hypothetical protein
MNRTDVINLLIWNYKFETYLEIGIRNPNHNFNKICVKRKYGVDVKPILGHNGTRVWNKTSDRLFSYLPKQFKFDVIFIDGDHTEAQAMKDIKNSMKHLTDKGIIVLHDCNPTTEWLQREKKQGCGNWNGTVWKAFVRYRYENPNKLMFVVDCDFGVGIISNIGHPRAMMVDLSDRGGLSDYKFFDENRVELLNLIDPTYRRIMEELVD